MKVGKIIRYHEETQFGEIKRTHIINDSDIDAYILYRNNQKIQTYIDFVTFVTKHDVEIEFFKDYYDIANKNIRYKKIKNINQINKILE